MFATYLINKGLVSRLSEKSKNQKEKDRPNENQANTTDRYFTKEGT